LKWVFEETKKSGTEIAEIELPFRLKIGEATIKGRIDRLDKLPDGTYAIVDYKTGNPKSLDEIKKDRALRNQLVLYKLAAEECLGVKISKMSFWYLEGQAVVEVPFNPKDQIALKEEIMNTIGDLKKSKFIATPGFHCRFCDYRSICEFRAV